jgi:hypothetical protein
MFLGALPSIRNSLRCNSGKLGPAWIMPGVSLVPDCSRLWSSPTMFEESVMIERSLDASASNASRFSFR